MSPRRDRTRTTFLSLAPLEDRSVPSANVPIPTPLTPTTITGQAVVTVPPVVPPPAPTASAPIGWQSYEGSATGAITATNGTTPVDIDTYTLTLDAGTRLTVIVDQVAGSLRPVLTVTGPLGTGPQPVTGGLGRSVEINALDVSVTGTYTISVKGANTTSAGSYRVRALVGTADETETISGNSNDSTFTFQNTGPQSLDNSLIDLGGGAKGITVNGTVGRNGTNFPQFTPGDLTDNYRVTVGAGQTLSVGLQKVAGTSPVIKLLDANGAPLATGTPVTGGNFDSAITYAGTGTFIVQVTGNTNSTTFSDPYLLSVVAGGVIDQEPNNLFTNAQVIPLNMAAGSPTVGGGVARGGIESSADSDWYSFTVPAMPATGQAYAITTRTPSDGAGEYRNVLNPELELYDMAGVPITTIMPTTGDDNRNAILYTNGLLPPGTYLIRVSSGTSATTGEYNLVIDRYTITPPNPPTTTQPTAENLAPIAVSAGGPYAITEGGTSITLQATATDITGDPLTYKWDLDNDGQFNDADGPNPMVTYSFLDGLGVGDGTRGYLFRVQVSDGTNTVVSLGTALTVTNAPPFGTLAIQNTQVVTEGTLAPQTVRVIGAGDPSAADVSAPPPPGSPPGTPSVPLLHYAFDLNGDGVFNPDDGDIGDGTYDGSVSNSPNPDTATIPASFFADGNTTVTVNAVVLDKDGGVSPITSVTIRVVNVPPTATFPPTGPFAEGSTGRTVALTGASDVSRADRLAGFTYTASFDGGVTFSAPSSDPNIPIPDALLAEGNSSFVVTIRVHDKDGDFSPYTRTISVFNVEPTATLSNSGPVLEGGAATVTVTGVADPSAADAAAGFRYSYDFNSDGDFTDPGDVGDGSTYGGSAAAGPQSVPAALLTDGSATGTTRTITVRTFDQDGDFSDATTVLTVTNAAPTGTFTAPGSATVGTPITLAFTGVADPSSVDVAAGFAYSFDLNNDGDFADAGEVSGAAAAAASVVLRVPGTVTIRGRVADKDGGFRDYLRTVTVSDVPPTISSVSTPPAVDEGSTSTVSVAAAAPSVTGPSTALRYAYDFNDDGVFDFGDGAGYATAGPSNVVTIPASFLDDGPGTRTIRVRVFDAYGASADQTTTTTVRNVAPAATLSGPTGRVEVFAPVTFTFSNVSDPSAADAAAGFRYSLDLNGNGSFTDPGDVLNSTSPVIQTAVQSAGVFTVRGVVTDKDGGSATYTARLNAQSPVKVVYAAGVDAGNAPVAKLYNARGQVIYENLVFNPDANGGVRVAAGDVNHDGVADLIAGTGPGARAEIKVIDGSNGQTLFDAFPFGDFAGGVFVAAGDFDGDGFADFAVTPDQGGGPRVILYSGQTLQPALSFFGIDDPLFRGGARVAMADVNGDGRADLLVAAGTGGGPRVAGYNGTTLLTTRGKLFNDFFAFDPRLRNGVYLAGGDLDGDGKSEIVTGAGPGGGPQVIAFGGQELTAGKYSPQTTFFGNNVASRAGIRVAVADVDGDGRSDILTGEADGPRLDIYLADTLTGSGPTTDPIEFFPFSAPTNGIFVG